MRTLKSALRLHDVTARDGLQNEALALTVSQKLKLIHGILGYQPSSIEVCSFVRGDKVPNMANAAELCQALSQDQAFLQYKAQGGTASALVVNAKGFDQFLKHKSVLDTAVVLVSCTDSHSKSNVNTTMKEALKNTLAIMNLAKNEGVQTRAYASLAFGCPFEGHVPEERVVDLCLAYRDNGADKVILADTLGVGKPEQVTSIVNKLLQAGFSMDYLGMHLHDSHNMAHLNVLAGWELGVRSFDASVGGCGGCNFAPGSKGNISIENLWRTLEVNKKETIDEAKWKALRVANSDLASMLDRNLEQ